MSTTNATREAIVRYITATRREDRRYDLLLARGCDRQRLAGDMVLKARRRESERLRLLCSQAVIDATQPHK